MYNHRNSLGGTEKYHEESHENIPYSQDGESGVFWDVWLFDLVDTDTGAYCLHRQGALIIQTVSFFETVNMYYTTRHNIPEDSHQYQLTGSWGRGVNWRPVKQKAAVLTAQSRRSGAMNRFNETQLHTRWLPSVLLRCVDWYKFTGVSAGFAAYILRTLMKTIIALMI
jgi:hypothetical protein